LWLPANAARRWQAADHIVDLVAPDETVQLPDTADNLLTAGTDTLDAEHLSPSGRYGRHRGRPS
jgi:hypothetical protein